MVLEFGGGGGGHARVAVVNVQAQDVVGQRVGQVKIMPADGQPCVGKMGRLQNQGLGHDGCVLFSAIGSLKTG